MGVKTIDDMMVLAASSGETENLRVYLASGANVHYMSERALILAAANGHAACLRVLLEAGAEVDTQLGTPLIRAVSNEFIEAARVLLEFKADINMSEGQALVAACTWGKPDMVELLLEAGADIHVRGDLPMLRAVSHGHAESFAMLLDAGADVFVSNSVGLLLASDDDDVLIAEMLEEAMQLQKMHFLAHLKHSRKTLELLQAPYVDKNNHQTKDSGITRALKMGCITDVFEKMQQAKLPMTEALLFDAKDSHGLTLARLITRNEDKTLLFKLFEPALWGGNTDNMMKAWNIYWSDLSLMEQRTSQIVPTDMTAKVASWRQAQMKAKAPKPPRFT